MTVTPEGVLLGSTLISSGSLQKQPSGDIYAGGRAGAAAPQPPQPGAASTRHCWPP